MKKFIISAIAPATIAAGGTTAFAASGNGQALKEETSQVCTVADQVRQCSIVTEKQADPEQCLYNGETPEDGTGMKNRAGQNSESGNGNQTAFGRRYTANRQRRKSVRKELRHLLRQRLFR